MSKRNYKVIGKGNDCKKCRVPMERRSHKDGFRVKPTQYQYFTEWDYCKPCGHVQHYEVFKRNTPKGHILEETNRQNSFLNNI